MALRVIGSGLGRTGTKSLQSALAMLGFGPCHHMVEVFARPESMTLWIEAAAGRPQWDEIFAEFQSAVDYPTAAHWQALAAYYTQAKIIHTVRDPDAWFDSTQATIFARAGMAAREMSTGTSVQADFFRSFAGPLLAHLHDRAFLTDYFTRHTEAVRAAIPVERLLIYQSGQGWEPLCAFLGVAVPDTAYPSENSRAAFIQRAAARD
jgi:hypothetical protein